MNAFTRFPRKLLALVAAVLLVPSGGALASQVFADSAGDAPGGAPDVTQVTVSHKLAGEITFAVAFANRGMIAGEDLVIVSLDSDQNPTTGDFGEDYYLGVSGLMPSAGLLMRGESVVAMLPVSWASSTMTVALNKSQIGSTKGLDFLLVSHTGGDMSLQNTEFVPHYGMSSYSLDVTIAQIQLPKVVTKVKAGKVFSVRGATVKLSTDEVFTPETMTAKATVAGKALKPLAGGLAWKVPKAAKGKKLVVTLAASYQGMQSTQTLTIKVVK
jgi:hypothetical protein